MKTKLFFRMRRSQKLTADYGTVIIKEKFVYKHVFLINYFKTKLDLHFFLLQGFLTRDARQHSKGCEMAFNFLIKNKIFLF